MKMEHLTGSLLVRAIDDELTSAEAVAVKKHLADCDDCRQAIGHIVRLSDSVTALVDAAPVSDLPARRDSLLAAMSAAEQRRVARQAPERVIRRFGLGMAIAATLALGIIFTPKPSHLRIESKPSEPIGTVAGAIEVDGESFVALPFSNPDLPVAAPRIVEMQVPVATLAELGVNFEPLANESNSQDRSVLADVLLGADGQPMGVHVLSVE